MKWEFVPRSFGLMRFEPFWKLGNFWVFETLKGWRIVGSPAFVGLTFESLGMAFLFAEKTPQPSNP